MIAIKINSPQNDFYDTMRIYWGPVGYYLSVIGTLALALTASTSYFIIMAQMMYPTTLALMYWVFDVNLPYVFSGTPTLSQYSQTYVAIALYIILATICQQRNLHFFIKMLSYGSVPIFAMIIFVVGQGLNSLKTTNFKIVSHPPPGYSDLTNQQLQLNERHLFMFNSNFAPLAGMLGIGYFLHPIALPIVRSNRNQRNNRRDVFLGYLFTFLSYIVIAIFGYIGFSGTYFTEYALRAEGLNKPIA